MGRRDSSSKTKSSKRKRDKISSKKKIRSKESKKRRRIYSTSESDNDSLYSRDSTSSTSESDHRRRINKNKKLRRDSSLLSNSNHNSVSSDSDSDNTNKGRKTRRSQVDLKDTKRRDRKRFTSPNVRKRKRSNKDGFLKLVKKSLKKKSRKYLSSSSSSDSENCSTGQSRSSSSTAEGECRRSKAVPNKDLEWPAGGDEHRGSRHPSVSVSNDDGSLFPTNNSRRLKSVIAFVNQPHDDVENRWEMDPQKEEVMYDKNDYPSPKSGNHSHGVFNGGISVSKVAGEGERELGKSRDGETDHDKAGDSQLEGAHTNDSEEKQTDVSVRDAALGGDLLESILRQKALENLRKKGKVQMGLRSTTVKMNNDSDNERSSERLVDSNVQAMESKGEISPMKEVKTLPDSKQVSDDPIMDKQSLVHPPNGIAQLECSNKDKSVSRSDAGPGTGGANACSSSSVEPSSSAGEHSLERGNEGKDSSQFEQKTMSVMKGGEIVQVSYKVYIPKKAPGLARRQLRR